MDETEQAVVRQALTHDEAMNYFSGSWSAVMQRGDAITKCDRFEIEPPTGRGFTGCWPTLFGYRGKYCLIVTSVMFPIERGEHKEAEE